MTVQGGGTLEIDSNANGMVLTGGTLHIESGGVMEVDKVNIQVDNFIMDDSSLLTADGKVIAL